MYPISALPLSWRTFMRKVCEYLEGEMTEPWSPLCMLSTTHTCLRPLPLCSGSVHLPGMQNRDPASKFAFLWLWQTPWPKTTWGGVSLAQTFRSHWISEEIRLELKQKLQQKPGKNTTPLVTLLASHLATFLTQSRPTSLGLALPTVVLPYQPLTTTMLHRHFHKSGQTLP